MINTISVQRKTMTYQRKGFPEWSCCVTPCVTVAHCCSFLFQKWTSQRFMCRQKQMFSKWLTWPHGRCKRNAKKMLLIFVGQRLRPVWQVSAAIGIRFSVIISCRDYSRLAWYTINESRGQVPLATTIKGMQCCIRDFPCCGTGATGQAVRSARSATACSADVFETFCLKQMEVLCELWWRVVSKTIKMIRGFIKVVTNDSLRAVQDCTRLVWEQPCSNFEICRLALTVLIPYY